MFLPSLIFNGSLLKFFWYIFDVTTLSLESLFYYSTWLANYTVFISIYIVWDTLIFESILSVRILSWSQVLFCTTLGFVKIPLVSLYWWSSQCNHLLYCLLKYSLKSWFITYSVLTVWGECILINISVLNFLAFWFCEVTFIGSLSWHWLRLFQPQCVFPKQYFIFFKWLCVLVLGINSFSSFPIPQSNDIVGEEKPFPLPS